MQLTFLGTGAGEGYPGLWCRCPHCTYARKTGGKNIRGNSCAVIDGQLMLDIGPMGFLNAARFQVDLTQAGMLLITHPHPDHLYPYHLHWRITDDDALSLPFGEQMHRFGPRFTNVPELHIYGNACVEKALSTQLDDFSRMKASFTRIREGETFTDNGYTVTPVRGNHHEPGFAHSYIIQKAGKTMMYALDSGIFDGDMLELVGRYQYDLIVMEGTTGLNEQYGGHMCLEANKKMAAFYREHDCLKPGCRILLSHMSPHWCPPHDWYETIVAQEGMELAYDGLTVEI